MQLCTCSPKYAGYEKGMVIDMILGTVQLGLEYGINNRTGKPSKELAYDILDYAYNNGIHMLDTASSYGDSEKAIGDYTLKTGNYFDICTKLPIEIEKHSLVVLLDESLKRLGYHELHTIYLHRFEQCKDKKILEQLIELKNKKTIEKIGISIYEPDELHYILKELPELIDIIQIPFNILDCYRWKEDGLLSHASEKFTIYARSIYLQGLLLMNVQDVFNDEVKKHLLWINEVAEKRNISVAELAMYFVENEPAITDFIVGCENVEQLIKNIDMSKNAVGFSNEEIQNIHSYSKCIDKNIVDPRTWNLK